MHPIVLSLTVSVFEIIKELKKKIAIEDCVTYF